jgi:uroporphyrin-III C-methyltransferase
MTRPLVPGTVYLVGAGPGDPELLTLRAARVLEGADVVFHDALVDPRTLALAARATRVAVGKRCGRHSTAQRFINKRLVDAARAGQVVVRLKGGDPMLFGRAQEEIDALSAAGIAVEVVPGVTAAFAAAAEISTSLTERGRVRSVAFVTPRVGADETPSTAWLDALRAADAGAVYMAAGEAASVARQLIAAGKPASLPVVVVASASLPQARTLHSTLVALANDPLPAFEGPVLLLIGPQFKVRARAALETSDAPAAPGRRRRVAG